MNKYENLIFTAMDISSETTKLIANDGTMLSCTKGMSDTEKKAYEIGISNTINALNALLVNNEYPVIHFSLMDKIEEISCDELIERLDKENYNGDII